MPKAKAVASLSGLVDTDMEEDTLNMDALPTPDSNQENVGSARKKGRPAKATAKRVTKSKAAVGRRASGDSIPPKKAALKKKTVAKRAPLKEKTSAQHAEDTEEVDEFAGEGNEDSAMDELVATKQPAKRKAPATKAGKKPGKQSKKNPVEQMKMVEEESAQQPKAVEKDGEFEYTPTTTRQKKRPGRPAAQKSKAIMRQTSVEPRQQENIIPETQVAMDVDQSELPEEDEEDEEALPQSVFRQTNTARGKIHQPQPLVSRRRAGSASDNERGGSDPATRRKLGEMTTKFEKLDMKYKTLREQGVKEANANFEKYKTLSQANAKGKVSLLAITAILTLFSCERPHRLPKERTRYAKSPYKRLSIPRKRNHHPRCRSSQNASSC